MGVWPVNLWTDGQVACGAVAWRSGEQLRLTAVVKATFSIVPGGEVEPRAPLDLVREDRHYTGDPSCSVEAASDLAPYLGHCDVTLVGHAYAPAGLAAQSVAVRLAVAGDASRIDRTLHVYGDRAADGTLVPFGRMPLLYERAAGGPGLANPVGSATPNLVDPADPASPAGFGPVARFWPSRARALGNVPFPRPFDGSVARFPDAMPWEHYQAAPEAQRMGYLRGGEWFVLDGLHPTLARLSTRLSQARGAARLRAPGGKPIGVRLALVADTLTIDADALTCSIVWRGRHDLDPGTGDGALAALTLMAGLELPDRAVAWPQEARRPRATDAGESTPRSARALAAPPGSERRTAPPPVPPVAYDPESTMVADLSQLAAGPRLAPFPIKAPLAAPPASAPRGAAIPGSPWDQARATVGEPALPEPRRERVPVAPAAVFTPAPAAAFTPAPAAVFTPAPAAVFTHAPAAVFTHAPAAVFTPAPPAVSPAPPATAPPPATPSPPVALPPEDPASAAVARLLGELEALRPPRPIDDEPD